MSNAGQPSRLSTGGFVVLFAVLLVLVAIPLFLTPVLPLLDYPNHLGRMHLLPSLPSPVLAPFYKVVWSPIPDLAMDGVVPILALIMPLAWAGKAFVLLTFLLLAGGTVAIYRVLFGGWSLWPCLAFQLLYTRLLLWGFMNYLFGCGLALTAFAVWIALRERHWAFRMAIGCIFALIIYISHLLAFGLYAVMIAGYEWGKILRLRTRFGAAVRALAVGGIPFLPALALMATHTSQGRIYFGNPLRKFDLLFSVFDNYNRPFDVTCFVLAVLAVAFIFWRRWVRLAPDMAGPLIGLFIAYIALPTQLFTASGVDRRIPMMIFLALIGGSQWVAPSPLFERRFMAAAGLMFAVRLGVVAVVWHDGGRLYARLLPGLDSVPRGSCIAPAFPSRGIEVQKAPLTHFPVLAVARRDAFVTTIFAYPTQQPIRLRPEARRLADLLSPTGLWHAFVNDSRRLSPRIRTALDKCGYVAFVGTSPFVLKNKAGLEPTFLTPRFKLYHAAPTVSPMP